MWLRHIALRATRTRQQGRKAPPAPADIFLHNTPHTLAGKTEAQPTRREVFRTPSPSAQLVKPTAIRSGQWPSTPRPWRPWPVSSGLVVASSLCLLCRRLGARSTPGTSGAAHDDTGCWLGRCGSGLWEWSGRLVAWEGQAVAPDLWRPLSAAATLSRRCRAGLSASILVFVVCGRDMRQCCTPRRQAAGSERSGEHRPPTPAAPPWPACGCAVVSPPRASIARGEQV